MKNTIKIALTIATTAIVTKLMLRNKNYFLANDVKSIEIQLENSSETIAKITAKDIEVTTDYKAVVKFG